MAGRRRRRVGRRDPAQPLVTSVRAWVDTIPSVLFHVSDPPNDSPWRYLFPILALAFVVRAAIALSGDFVIHPDEIMQYLEPAHRLVFGNGAFFWEYHYGARSWLIPGLVAVMLKLFDLAGLGEPMWYVGGVKLGFCAISLLIPAGMYFTARQHFGETTARIALIAGAFWYELVGFAHKPMTEFVAATLLLALLALCTRPDPNRTRLVVAVAFLVVLTTAVRFQYAPLTLALWGLFFLRTDRKIPLTLASTAFLAAIGIFDAVTWNAEPFHSYLLNFRVNLVLGDLRAGESASWQYLYWLALASAGLAALCVMAALRDVRRYGLLLGLIVLTLVVHSAQPHKEYRFIFAVIPLWLLIGADVTAWLVHSVNARLRSAGGESKRSGRRREFGMNLSKGAWRPLVPAGVVFMLISAAGILNALPYQSRVYQAWSNETGIVRFIRGQDSAFAAYRYLADAPDVAAVLDSRSYFNTPGYYYLHRKIPLYAGGTTHLIFPDPDKVDTKSFISSVSHIVTANPADSIPGYVVEERFGDIRLLRRDMDEPPIRQWESYTPTFATGIFGKTAAELHPDAPSIPPNVGIRFTDEPNRE